MADNDRGGSRIRTVDLLRNCRDALRALTPMCEFVRIPWHDGDAYDQWDVMANAVFETLVVDAIQWSSEVDSSFKLAGYDMQLASYSSLSFLTVASGIDTFPHGAFLRFVTENRPFDSVLVNGLNGDFDFTGCQTTIPVDDALVRLSVRLLDGSRIEVDCLNVDE